MKSEFGNRFGEAPLGFVDCMKKARKSTFSLPNFLLSKLEDLEPVFGDRDSHTLEELVIEMNQILFLNLIVDEGEAKFVSKRRLEVGFE